MPTVKTLVLAFLSTLTISSAQLDARHPNAGLSEGYLNGHDLYARAEPELRNLNVRDPIFGSRIIKGIIKGAEKGNNAAQQVQSYQNQNQRREADPIFGSRIIKDIIKGARKGSNAAQNVQSNQDQNQRREADPIFGSRIIKGIIKGAEKGNNAAQQVQSYQNQNQRREAEAEAEAAADPIFGSRIIKGIIKGAEKGNNAAQQVQSYQNQNQRREAEAEAEADEIYQRGVEWDEGLYTRDAYSEADWVPLYW